MTELDPQETQERAFNTIVERTIFPATQGLSPQAAEELFNASCWGWKGSIAKGKGGGNPIPIIQVKQLNSGWTVRSARRMLWEIYYDTELQATEGVYLTCRSTTNLCMNPAHFEMRTKGLNYRHDQRPKALSLLDRMASQLEESVRRPITTKTQNKVKRQPKRKRVYKACINGHIYEDGSYTVDGAGYRRCRKCRSDNSKRYRAAGIPVRWRARDKWREKAIEYLNQV